MINLNHYKKGKNKLSYSSYSTIFKKGDSSGEKNLVSESNATHWTNPKTLKNSVFDKTNYFFTSSDDHQRKLNVNKDSKYISKQWKVHFKKPLCL